MTTAKHAAIEQIVAAVQQRWGVKALRRLEQRALNRTGIPTGYAALDQLLGTGGIPRGALTCLSGQPTVGKTSLALDVLVRAQAENEVAVYIDGSHAADPEYGEGRGLDLGRLLVVWPQPVALGLEIARDLIVSGGAGVIVFDTGGALRGADLAASLRRLHAALRQSPYVLICLHGGPSGRLAEAADVQLHLTRRGWLIEGERLTGYEVDVSVSRNRFAAPGQAVTLAIRLVKNASENRR